MKKMDVQIKTSNEEGLRVLRETNGKRPACMKKAGIQQNAKGERKMDSFYMILFITLILLATLRVTIPIAILICGVVLKPFF